MPRSGSSSTRQSGREASHHGGEGRRLILGAFLVGCAALLAALLVYEHVSGRGLPGCGPASACARVTSGPWGRLPAIDWPVSFIGLAYFASLLAGWILVRGRLAPWSRWLIRAGATCSIMFLTVMLVERLLCPYCIGAHAAHLAFWLLAEFSPRPVSPDRAAHLARAARRALPIAAAVFVGVSALLGVLDMNRRERETARAEQDLAASTARITSAPSSTVGFTGRYRLGPERAALRIVVFTDYQCPDCRRIEGQLRAAQVADPRISLSVKHFPFCTLCNPGAPNLHPNACWAARAAEAAGILAGPDGFWRTHDWLFSRSGAFTDSELNAALPALGFAPARFLEVMTGSETLARVEADIAEGFALGLAATPMIFVNGVELRGWQAEDGVPRALAAALAANPAPGDAASDAPPPAVEKALADWREGPLLNVPSDGDPHILGVATPRVTVILFGDYQEPFTAEADGQIRALLASNPGLRYDFRHYPVDQACNPSAPRTAHPLACLAAKAAEVAAFLKGPDEFWAQHAHLLASGAGLSAADILDTAQRLGLEPQVFADALDLEEISGAILEDIGAADALGITSVPMIIINNRLVPRWNLDGRSLLADLIAEAGRP